jgi:hypothetical protein
MWLALLLFAVADGMFRELYMKPIAKIREPWAHRVTAFIDGSVFFMIVFVFWDSTGLKSWSDVKLTSLLWFFITAFTESVVVCHFVFQMTYDEVLQTYNLLDGELWPIVLVWVTVLPLICRDLRGPVRSSSVKTRTQ